MLDHRPEAQTTATHMDPALMPKSPTSGTVTLRWPETGEVETRPLSTAMPPQRLEEIPAMAAEEHMSPAEFLVDCLLLGGFDVISVDWRGPS